MGEREEEQGRRAIDGDDVLELLYGVLGQVEEVAVGELDTLGATGRAGRVDDHRGVVVGAIGHVGDGLGRTQQLLELPGLGEHALRQSV